MADVQKTIANFEKKGFKVSYFETGKEAVAYMGESIQKTSVGIGGSVTVRDLGLDLELAKYNTVAFPMRNPAYLQSDTIRIANYSKVYITSANAVSEEGQILNIDGRGNRVSGSAYGAERVYFVVGTNKIESSFEKALRRARNIAGPLNNRRLNTGNPCTVGELKCHDCNSTKRICNVLSVLDRPLSGSQTEVVIINEELGF